MKLQSETETQRNILKGEMNMLFQTESGQTVGPIGQGTWYLGEDPDRFDAECSALRAGVEAGMNLIDTAEMYGTALPRSWWDGPSRVWTGTSSFW